MSAPIPTPDITLHHLNASRSERLFWALEEMGISYKVKVWYRDPIQAPKELKTIHPLGKAPVLVNGGNTIAESGAIIEYLQQTYTPPKPYSLPSSYFSHYAEGTLMLMIQMLTTFDATAVLAPWFIRPVIGAFVGQVRSVYLLKQIQANVELMEGALAKSPTGWFGEGPEPSAGDFMLLYPIHALLTNPTKFPNLKYTGALRKWMDKVEAREGYKKGLARMEEEEKAQKLSGAGKKA